MKDFYLRFKRGFFTEGSFFRNIIVFTSGSLLAYVIGFVFTPILTRIYSPEDYGHFAFLNTVLAILFSVSTLNYSEALILPKKTKDFYRLCRLVAVLSVSSAVLFFLFILLYKESFLQFFNLLEAGNAIYIVAPLLLFSVLQLIADNFNIRKKQFAVNSRAKVASVIISKGSVAGIGIALGSSVWGLISGEVINRVINYFGLLGKNTLRLPYRLLRGFSTADLVSIGREYKEYPLYIFPASLLLQLSLHIPVFIISRDYSAEMLGYYSMAITLLGIPVQVIGFSIGKVFLQRASEIVQSEATTGLYRRILQLFYASTIFAVGGYSIIYFFGVNLFSLVIGEEWAFAGEVAVLLAPGLAFQLVATIIMPSYRVLKIERQKFYAEIAGAGILIIAVFIFSSINMDFLVFIYLFSFLLFLKYFITIGILFGKMRFRFLAHLILPFFIFLGAYLLLYFNSAR